MTRLQLIKRHIQILLMLGVLFFFSSPAYANGITRGIAKTARGGFIGLCWVSKLPYLLGACGMVAGMGGAALCDSYIYINQATEDAKKEEQAEEAAKSEPEPEPVKEETTEL